MRLPLLCCGFVLVACGSRPSDPDGGAGGGAGGGTASTGTCEGLPVACGVLGSGDASVDCGTCFFDRARLGATSYDHVSMVSAPSGVHVGWYGNTQVLLSSELDDGGFTTDVIDPDGTGTEPVLSVALKPGGGAPAVAYARSFEIWLATERPAAPPDGGKYESRRVTNGHQPSLAFDGTGKPYLAYQRTRFAEKMMYLATPAADGGWAETQLEWIDAGFMGAPKVVLDASGAPHVLYLVDRSPAQNGLHHFSGGSIEVVTPGGLGGGANGQLDAVFDSSGALHAVWPAYPFALMYGRRAGGAWSVLPVSNDNAGHEHNALAIDAQGRPIVAFHTFSALKLSAFNGSSFSVQGVLSCDQGGVALALDARSRLRLASACGSTSVLTLNGKYPAGHAAACEQLSSAVCSLACGACKAADNDCCLKGTSLRTCTNRCSRNIGGLACDDATKPQALFDACLGAAGGLMCAMPATDGVDVSGTPCDSLFEEP